MTPPDTGPRGHEVSENALTPADIHRVALHGVVTWAGGRLTRDDLVAMTEPTDWVGDWHDVSEAAAGLIAADLNERHQAGTS